MPEWVLIENSSREAEQMIHVGPSILFTTCSVVKLRTCKEREQFWKDKTMVPSACFKRTLSDNVSPRPSLKQKKYIIKK